ncbi:lipoprotein [Spiroplasma endosymbiont of Atherix ibis]|uniref:lipoprotein n=1 Tax=Spiroplasma endosymbiont of Atherix ibis TaxID=3066291 RepID=UPI0030D2F2EE
MKKLLSLLAIVGFVASSAVSVVACVAKSDNKPEESKKNITQVVRNFEQDVAKIWSEHYEKEVASNLITVEDVKNDYKFLNKENIQKFSKSENKLTVEHKKQLTSDAERLFQNKLLKHKLNELKKVNEYKIILDEVDSVFEHIELLFNDIFEINLGEVVEGSYIGNVVVDYNIVTNYKGLNDVEKFKQFGALKYTSTES